MNSNPPAKLSPGLYAITPENLQGDALLYAAEEVLVGGARVLQYRDKTRETGRRRDTAIQLRELCHRFRAQFLINDDIELAGSVAADGVHLGETDPSIDEARGRLGPSAIIGISCYDEWSRAAQAVACRADYVAFGAFFPSVSKQTTRRADPGLLGQARDVGIAAVAIGGIRTDNGAPLVAAGAHCLAVIDALWNAPDRCASARQFASMWATRS